MKRKPARVSFVQHLLRDSWGPAQRLPSFYKEPGLRKAEMHQRTQRAGSHLLWLDHPGRHAGPDSAMFLAAVPQTGLPGGSSDGVRIGVQRWGLGLEAGSGGTQTLAQTRTVVFERARPELLWNPASCTELQTGTKAGLPKCVLGWPS